MLVEERSVLRSCLLNACESSASFSKDIYLPGHAYVDGMYIEFTFAGEFSASREEN